MRLSVLFIILPGVVMSFKKLLKEKKARWNLLEKYVRSVIYLSLFGALPACTMCELMKLFPNNYGKAVITFQFFIGAFVAYRFEKPARHA